MELHHLGSKSQILAHPVPSLIVSILHTGLQGLKGWATLYLKGLYILKVCMLNVLWKDCKMLLQMLSQMFLLSE